MGLSPFGLWLVGKTGVCGCLAVGQRYSLDTWGHAEASNRFRT
jgi:hypothetical protein